MVLLAGPWQPGPAPALVSSPACAHPGTDPAARDQLASWLGRAPLPALQVAVAGTPLLPWPGLSFDGLRDERGGPLAARSLVDGTADPGVYRDGDGGRFVVLAPSVAPLPRGFAWSVPVWGASAAPPRRGDLGSLAEVVRWAASTGARAVVASPLHCGSPHGEASPYFPSTRTEVGPEWLDPALVARRWGLPGPRPWAPVGPLVDPVGDVAARLLDLSVLWEASAGARARGQEVLAGASRVRRAVCAFMVASGRHRGPWWEWPVPLRRPTAAVVAALCDDPRAAFWAWLFDEAAVAAHGVAGVASGAGVDLCADLAVGFDRGGADGWLVQDWAAPATLGVPPDAHNGAGRDWGLAALDPRWLLSGDRDVLDATLGSLSWAHGVRADHAAGCWRQWFRPHGGTGGAYVDAGALPAALLALAAGARGQWVVAEDLGTVPGVVRTGLGALAMSGFRLATGFDGCEDFAGSAVAWTTHDLPTAVGTGTLGDLADQAACGVPVDAAALHRERDRLVDAGGLRDGWPVAAARVLAGTGGRLLVATVEDAAGAPHRPNMPGVDASVYPSWRRPLPPVGTWGSGGLVHADAVAEVLAAAAPQAPSP